MDLLDLACWGDMDGVKKLIQQGISVNTTNRAHQTALYIACESGKTKVAQYLLECGASTRLGAKPLIAAVRNGHYDCVELLLKHHANVHCTNYKRETPMYVAQQKGHYSIIWLLLQYGVFPPTSLGDISVQLVNHAGLEHLELITKLTDNNIINLASENVLLAVFRYACKHQIIELAERMLSKDSRNVEQLYPVAAFYCAKHNWLEVLSTLLEKHIDVNMLTEGQTPLYVACKEGNESIVTLLLNNGADPNIPSKTSSSNELQFPIQLAVHQSNTAIFNSLLAKGAKLHHVTEPLLHIVCGPFDEWKTAGDVKTRSVENVLSMLTLLLDHEVAINAISDRGDTALYRACKSQQLDAVQRLLEGEADVNLTTRSLFPLIAACETGNAVLISLLLNAGADVKCSNVRNETCLHVVVDTYTADVKKSPHRISTSNVVNTIKLLLECGLNVDAHCSQKETALYRASEAGHEDVVRVLLEAGAETSGSSSRRPLYTACEHGHTRIVQLLLQHGADSNLQSTFTQFPNPYLLLGRSANTEHTSLPICCAVKKGYLDIVSLLLKHGTDVNKPESSGKSSLIYVIEYVTSQSQCVGNPVSEKTYFDILKSMLLAGGDVNLLSASDGLNPLHIAILSGRCDIMSELIQHGAECNRPTANGKSAVDLAYEQGNEATLELLLKNGAKPDDVCHSRTDRRASSKAREPVLCMAAKNNKETVIKLLLKHSVDVNASCQNGNTALHLTASSTIMESLLKAGANVNAENDRGETMLSITCSKQQASASVVEMLLKFGADPNIRFPLHDACETNNIDLVRLLLRYGADSNRKKQSATQFSPLWGNFRENTRYASDGLNPLHIAILSGRCDIMSELIQHGAKCNILTANGKSAVELACQQGNEAALEMLLKNGAKPEDGSHSRTDSRALSKAREPALCIAAKNNKESVIKLLLKHAADVNASCQNGDTALHLTTSSTIMESLLKAGANVNAANDRGETMLSITCSKQQASADVVEMLLKFGADPNIRFPLHDACETNNVDVVRLLLRHGADSNRKKQSTRPTTCRRFSLLSSNNYRENMPTALSIAVKNGNVPIVDCLLKSGACAKILHSDGTTPLHFAIERLGNQTKAGECDTIVTLLLQHKAPVNVVSVEGETPVYLACSKGLVSVVKQLLDCKADVGLTNCAAKYPLLVCCERRFTDIAVMLLNHGADANVSKNYMTPLKFAAANGDIELVKELLTSGADVNRMHGISDTALHVAAVPRKGLKAEICVNIVNWLLKCGAEANTVNRKYETPLYLACKLGSDVNIDIVQALLKRAANPDLCPFGGSSQWSYGHIVSPLIAAVRCNNTGLMSLLIKFGARVDRKDEDGRTALHYIIGDDDLRFTSYMGSSKSDTSAAEILLSAGAEVNAVDNGGSSPLYMACKGGKTDFVKLLLNRGANPNLDTLDKYRYPILAACNCLCYDAVKLLLEYKVDVSVQDNKGKTALHYALEGEMYYSPDNEKKSAIVQLLLDETGTDINASSADGQIPLYVACSRGLSQIVSKMLDCGAKVDAHGEKLPLNTACINKHLAVVQLLLAKGANPNDVGKEDCCTSPLHIAASGDSNELVEVLLTHGANVNAADGSENTALHHAVRNYYSTSWRYSGTSKDSKKTVIDILLQNKADANFANSSSETPLYIAVSRGLVDVVRKMLEEYEGNPNKASPVKNPLTEACQRSNVQLVNMLLKHGANPNLGWNSCDLKSTDKLALCVAVEQDNEEIVTLLLQAGALVNAMNSNGKSAVCLAVEKLTNPHYLSTETMRKHVATVRLLLDHGGDLNLLMPDGRSLLQLVVTHLAGRARNDEQRTWLIQLIQLFMKYGASLHDYPNQPWDIKTLKALMTYDGKHGFLVDLLRAGAGFQLLSFCCNAVAPRQLTHRGTIKSICLCQAAILGGYKPSAEEMQDLRQEVASNDDVDVLLVQLLDWLNDDRQQVPSLQRQCRIAIRRQLSTAGKFRTILPAIEKLPLPPDLKLYLQFDGRLTEVDLSVLQTDDQSRVARLEPRTFHGISLYSLLLGLESRESDVVRFYDRYDYDYNYYEYDPYDSFMYGERYLYDSD